MKNVFKILSFSLVLGVLIFTTSCGEDDGVTATPDVDAPAITINAPADGAIVVAGSQVASSISIEDDAEISSVSITIGNGIVTILDVMEEEVANESFSFSDNLLIPADVVLGEHTLTITVEDASGNSTTKSITLEAYPVYTDGETTIMITSVPDQIADYSNETIYAVGTIQENQWSETSGSDPLSTYTDSEGAVTYYIQAPATGYEFKFVRGLDWLYGQKDAEGKEQSNNMVEAGAKKAEFEIASWRDYNPEVNNDSNGTVIAIDGSPSQDTYTVKGSINPAPTPMAAITSANYFVIDGSDVEVATGSLTLDGENKFSESIDISTYAVGSYTVKITASDDNGSIGREDEVVNLVEFPCDDSSEATVSATMTRIIVNVPSTSDDIYATGIINGENRFGHDYPEELKLTKLSDGCYYIDLAVISTQVVDNEPNDRIQIIRKNAGYGADWWKGQATNTAGSDASANFNVDTDSDGNTVKLYYAYWREEPPM